MNDSEKQTPEQILEEIEKIDRVWIVQKITEHGYNQHGKKTVFEKLTNQNKSTLSEMLSEKTRRKNIPRTYKALFYYFFKHIETESTNK